MKRKISDCCVGAIPVIFCTVHFSADTGSPLHASTLYSNASVSDSFVCYRKPQRLRSDRETLDNNGAISNRLAPLDLSSWSADAEAQVVSLGISQCSRPQLAARSLCNIRTGNTHSVSYRLDFQVPQRLIVLKRLAPHRALPLRHAPPVTSHSVSGSCTNCYLSPHLFALH